jgi:N-acetylglucosamine repressor
MNPVKKKNEQIALQEAVLLRHVRENQGISRTEIAKLMRIAPSTVGIYVERLIRDGYLFESQHQPTARGRPRTPLQLNPEGGYLLGVDIEAHRVRAVCLDFSETILESKRVALDDDATAESILDEAVAAVRDILPKDPKKILGLGIASPGPVDLEKGIGIHYRYIRGWDRVPVVKLFEERLHLPVSLENNIRALTSAELWFGKGRSVSDFVCIGVRTGIGAGVVAGGEVCLGLRHAAGEIGSWGYPVAYLPESVTRSLTDTTDPCVELERVASVRAVRENLSAAVRDGAESRLSAAPLPLGWDDIVAAFEAGDPVARDHVHAAADALGWAAAQLAVLLDPQKILVAGPFVQFGPALLGRVRESVAAQTSLRHMAAPETDFSDLGDYSGAIGAAGMVLKNWAPPR